MGHRRAERVASLILAEISAMLLREVKDPRVAMANVTAVRMSDDLQVATVYFVAFPPQDRDRTLAGLESARPYIRGQISRRLRLRRAPDLRFTYDSTGDEAQRVESLLRETRKDG